MKVGVLDLQGDVIEHVRALEAAGAEVVRVKRPRHLEGLRGLVIPGGESTTIGKLMAEYELIPAVRQAVSEGMAVFGTCAGAILLAADIAGSDQPRLGLMDMRVQRNAYGRQRESFEAEVQVSEIPGPPVKAVFIRAPIIERVGSSVKVLAEYGGQIVMARQGRLLAGTFHPELTADRRVHQYFLQLCAEDAEGRGPGAGADRLR
ncbi:MAG: pyridoxal 5'-phosphate synthase glutaminase subunit PdxT [Firmicutes bacterium]|nr:pyridoxal 5'-phosphate synthase glutaminase subunit PdxT [Bacillota bacterium]